MKFLARRCPKGLAPIDALGEEALGKIKVGAVVTVEVKKARNPNLQRLYWALIHKVWAQQSLYPTPHQLHTAMKLSCGCYEQILMPSGEFFKVPSSTAFNAMDQVAFSAYFDRVCDLIAEYILPGIEAADLKAELENMIGVAA